MQSAQSGRDAAQHAADASKKQLEQLKARFAAFEQHEHELLGQLASAEAGMRGSRVTSSRLLQEGQRLEGTVSRLLSCVVWRCVTVTICMLYLIAAQNVVCGLAGGHGEPASCPAACCVFA